MPLGGDRAGTLDRDYERTLLCQPTEDRRPHRGVLSFETLCDLADEDHSLRVSGLNLLHKLRQGREPDRPENARERPPLLVAVAADPVLLYLGRWGAGNDTHITEGPEPGGRHPRWPVTMETS